MNEAPAHLAPIKRFLLNNVLLLFLIGIAAAIAIFVPPFRTQQNLVNVLIQISIMALMATGMTFVILTGGIDLSVGSIAALSGVAAAAIIREVPDASVTTCVGVGLVASVVVGGLCGGVTGFAVTKMRVAPFIATLAMMIIARGFAYVYTQSRPIFGLPDSFNWVGAGKIGQIPVIVLIMVSAIVVAQVILDRTLFGRHVYAVGSNEEVAHLCGVHVDRIKFAVYVISGMLSAFAGFCLASKLLTGDPSVGEGYELEAITAVVMGGTSLFGGKGSVTKTAIGILTIGVINNGLSLMQVSSYWQKIAMGCIILVAVALDQVRSDERNGS